MAWPIISCCLESEFWDISECFKWNTFQQCNEYIITKTKEVKIESIFLLKNGSEEESNLGSFPALTKRGVAPPAY